MARVMKSRPIETDYLHYSEYTGFSDQLLLEALKIDYDTDVPSDVSFMTWTNISPLFVG